MEIITAQQKARYIVSMVKSVNKSLDYALDIVTWYTMTHKQETEVREIIKQIW